MKIYSPKLAYNDYVKFCKDENYFSFSNTEFELKLKSVVDVHKTTKDYKTVRYNQIKDDVKPIYETEELELTDDEVEIQDE
jgi:hypothetical protein